MENRRTFIRNSVVAGMALSLGGWPLDAFAKKEVAKITILHTNDVHSQIDPFPANHPKFPNMGGANRRMIMINHIRTTEKNVLLLDAGDMFQGTPYYNKYKGELELKLMSQMKYDAGCIGNHDFDNGVDALSKILFNANFPLIVSNYNFDNTPMKGKTLPYKIFIKDDIKIGVFGLGIELRGLVDKNLSGDTQYHDPVVAAAQQSLYLKEEEKCDLIICLSHLGFKYKDEKISDIALAKQSKNIDLIIGAHTHTFLDEPINIINRDGKKVLVAQAGWAGLRLGRIDFYFEKNTKKKMHEASTLKIFNYASAI